ncbi:dehydrase and lipid transport-domain-containing protein [Hygrophoropsis aurantiaca]|uniref:Dehydrase and lipid transport-domain-containing protein n=1 Tax=Hygrophoropsis aurantiaca TaxID=72124 RepID=A0ACB8ARY9_9AGAM|nr:dehydrase and lipid transport-domain-containing protein [Hygrophoropsis aurantiaca]
MPSNMLRALSLQTQTSLRQAALSSRIRRHFFTLPNLSSLSPFPESNESQEDQTYHERKILPYRRSDLYRLVADVESYPSFVPYCTGSRILGQLTGQDRVVTMDAELTVGFLAFKDSYVSKVTCRPYESVEAVASSSTPLFKRLTTVWRFQSASAESPHPSAGSLSPHHSIDQMISEENRGPTLVTLDIAFAFANPVYATASATFLGKVSKLMVGAFEERCLAVLGPGSK